VGFVFLGVEAPAVVVEQDTAAYYALFAPGAYAVFVCGWVGVGAVAVDIGESDAVVEDFFFLVAEVAEAVLPACVSMGNVDLTGCGLYPLRARLRVEGPDIIVDYSGCFLVDILVKGLAAEEREVSLSV
jgi:hypothetical protein